LGERRKWLVGVDEAGRGSLVGEMIVAVVAVPEDAVEDLVEAGVRDSKELSPAARARLYRAIAGLAAFAVEPVDPRDIDRRSMAVLTEEAIARAFERVARRVGADNIARVVVDRYGRPRRIRALLSRAGYRGPILVEEKADARYPEVSAASIVAKHVRDARIRVLSSLYGVEGSGYPSDPRTVDWVLRTVGSGEKPPIIRYSWGTLDKVGARVRKPRDPGRPTLEDFM